VDPTGQSDRLADVRRAQLVAMMRSFHFKIKYGSGRKPPLQKRTRIVAVFAVDFKEKFSVFGFRAPPFPPRRYGVNAGLW